MLKTMNFDIKYTKNLKSMNFIKIKQILGTILGAQSQGSIAKAFNQPGYKLEMVNKLADKWDPQIRDREITERKCGFMVRRFGKPDKGDPHAVAEVHISRAQTDFFKRGAGFKTQRNRPLRYTCTCFT